MELTIDRSRDDRGWAVVTANGEIDIATATQLDEALEASVSEGHAHVAVDLEQVSFMDSTGLRSLIACDRRVGELEGELAIVAPSGAARRILEVTGVAGTLRVVDSVRDLPQV